MKYPVRMRFSGSGSINLVVEFTGPKTGTVIESSSYLYKIGDYRNNWTDRIDLWEEIEIIPKEWFDDQLFEIE